MTVPELEVESIMPQRSSWGSITRLGKDRYRLRYVADMHDGKGRVRHSETVRGTRKEARRVLSEREAAHGRDVATLTVGECAERFWMPDMADRLAHGTMKPTTVELYTQIYRTHVEPRWGTTMVSGIDPLEYQEWLLTLTDVIGAKCNMLMRQILRFAVMYRLAPTNVADVQYRLSGDRDRHPATVWPLRELAEMVYSLRGTVLEAPCIMMAFGSCRVGEACGLRSSDFKAVDANGMHVLCAHVQGQLARDGWVDWTKTPDSMRWVVVPEPWSLRLEEIMSDGREWLNDDGLGRPVPRANVSWWWRRVFEQGRPLAGHEYGPIKNLRASWRTAMRAELRMDRDLLEKMMGHSGNGVGEIHYFRPDEEAFADELSRAWNAYRERQSLEHLGPVGTNE